jgi:hypothetical protein
MSYEITPHHPVPLELANSHSTFVERARQWNWRMFDKRLPVPPSGWPPGVCGSFGVYDYWYTLIQKNKTYNPNGFVEPTSLETAVALALALSEQDPMIELAYSFSQWITLTIQNKDELVSANRITSWAKFAASTYDVVLDDGRTGRCHDAAFDLKVAAP